VKDRTWNQAIVVPGQDNRTHRQALKLFHDKADQIVTNPVMVEKVTSNDDQVHPGLTGQVNQRRQTMTRSITR